MPLFEQDKIDKKPTDSLPGRIHENPEQALVFESMINELIIFSDSDEENEDIRQNENIL